MYTELLPTLHAILELSTATYAPSTRRPEFSTGTDPLGTSSSELSTDTHSKSVSPGRSIDTSGWGSLRAGIHRPIRVVTWSANGHWRGSLTCRGGPVSTSILDSD
eukprot:3424817-Rhodomonas_salina.1